MTVSLLAPPAPPLLETGGYGTRKQISVMCYINKAGNAEKTSGLPWEGGGYENALNGSESSSTAARGTSLVPESSVIALKTNRSVQGGAKTGAETRIRAIVLVRQDRSLTTAKEASRSRRFVTSEPGFERYFSCCICRSSVEVGRND